MFGNDGPRQAPFIEWLDALSLRKTPALGLKAKKWHARAAILTEGLLFEALNHRNRPTPVLTMRR